MQNSLASICILPLQSAHVASTFVKPGYPLAIAIAIAVITPS